MNALDFENRLLERFSAKPLSDGVVSLCGLTSADENFAKELYGLIQESREHLGRHLPWVRETDEADVRRKLHGWILAETLSQGCCWKITVGERKNLAGFIMMELMPKNRSASISYWLFKDFTGKGYMGRSLELVSVFAFDGLSLNRLEMSISVKNPESMAVARRACFVEEGLCRDYELVGGVFEDHLRFSKLSRDRNCLHG